MLLALELGRLRDRVLSDLNAAYDYYADTRTAWTIVEGAIAAGQKVVVRNVTTGTLTTEAALVDKIRGYIAE